MAFVISNDFDPIEFEIPAGKTKTVTISVPPFDCYSPADIAAMNADIKKYENDDEIADVNNPAKTVTALLRFQLKHFNPGKQKADAIDALTVRQLNEIDKIWTAKSEVTLGESETSTDDSSETEK
ncbi:hypothetical protein [uncultured Corynebacterium sp.]|uniref:hypothetical protein n=1 Tax=uncultured Corynebacterium sp. TaxID=159447 RepID=UPI002599E406|nr:hypothetical protein [uncultured Corynebacterium sp.]